MGLFNLGQIVATPGALKALEESAQGPLEFIRRHHRLEQGLLDDDDHQQNQDALKDGNRMFSAFRMDNGEKLWVITEADRSSTTLLLPEEY